MRDVLVQRPGAGGQEAVSCVADETLDLQFKLELDLPRQLLELGLAGLVLKRKLQVGEVPLNRLLLGLELPRHLLQRIQLGAAVRERTSGTDLCQLRLAGRGRQKAVGRSARALPH